MKKSFWAKKILGIMILVPLAVSFFSWIVMLLWNNVLAVVTAVSIVTFWQAMGLLVLSKILFGGFKGGRGGAGSRFKHEMKDKWQNMSSEERVQFKQQWRDRCKTWATNCYGQPRQKDEAGAE